MVVHFPDHCNTYGSLFAYCLGKDILQSWFHSSFFTLSCWRHRSHHGHFTKPPLHYALRSIGAAALRILKFSLSFSSHPNISDVNFTLVPHFIHIQIFWIDLVGPKWTYIVIPFKFKCKQIEKKVGVEFWQIWWDIWKLIISDSRSFFSYIRGCFSQKKLKSKYLSNYRNVNFETCFVCKNTPFTFFFILLLPFLIFGYVYLGYTFGGLREL